jgi:hypothetical protein
MRTSENTPSETVRKGGTSNAPSMDLASMRRKKWAERPLFGVLLDHAAGAFGTFRTVSLGTWVNRARGSQECSQTFSGIHLVRAGRLLAARG